MTQPRSIYDIYDTASTSQKQVLHKEMHAIRPGLLENPDRLRSFLSRSDLSVLNLILFRKKIHNIVWLSQSTIAQTLKISRMQVNRSIKKLVSLGLLHKIYRQSKTCFYDPAPIFTQPKIRSLFSHFLTALRWVPVISLCVKFTSHRFSEQNVTQYKNKLKEYKYKLNIPSIQWKSDAKIGVQMQEGKVHDMENREIAELTSKPISLAIRSVTDKLRLTKWGQIRLAAYPDTAIYWSRREMMNAATEIENPLAYFIKLCEIYCEREKITPDHAYSFQLAQKYKKPESAKLSLSEEEYIAASERLKQIRNSEIIQVDKNKVVLAHIADTTSSKKNLEMTFSSDASLSSIPSRKFQQVSELKVSTRKEFVAPKIENWSDDEKQRVLDYRHTDKFKAFAQAVGYEVAERFMAAFMKVPVKQDNESLNGKILNQPLPLRPSHVYEQSSLENSDVQQSHLVFGG